MTLLKEIRLHLFNFLASTNTFLLHHLCRRGSAFTTGTLGADEVRKMLSIEKQIAGKWHLITLPEASDNVEHEILHERFHVTHFAGTRTPFILTSASKPSTFTTRGEVCKIILLKENMFCHVPLFVVLQPVVRKFSPYYRCTSAIFMPRKEVLQENHPDHSCSYDLSKH